jgi:hypothetical protein
MPSIANAVTNLAVGILFLLAGTTVIMLFVRRYVPVVGESLWRYYRRVLLWIFRAPFRLVRRLVHEIARARRRP